MSMRNLAMLFLLIGCFTSLSGCANHPKLTFYKLDAGEEPGEKYTFKMPSPVITITANESDKLPGGWAPNFTPTVTSRKITDDGRRWADSADVTYAIEAFDPWYYFGIYNANYGMAYQTNSQLVKQLSVEVTDNTTKYIQTLGSIAVAAIPAIFAFDMSAAQPSYKLVTKPITKQPAKAGEKPAEITYPHLSDLHDKLPFNLNAFQCFSTSLSNTSGKPVSCKVQITGATGDEGWYAVLVANPSGAKLYSYEEIFSKKGITSNQFPVPPCVDGYIFVEYEKNNAPVQDPNVLRFINQIAFAHPTKLSRTLIPLKGSISYHSACSADIASTPATVSTPSDWVKTGADEAALAIAAYQKATTPASP